MRPLLDSARVDAAIAQTISAYHRDTIDEVIRAVGEHDIVIVGMAQNPFCKKARALLEAKGLTHSYLEYGSYFGDWKRRLALKMWSGWPTFPMVFVKGQLVGGKNDLEKLIRSGELHRRVQAA